MLIGQIMSYLKARIGDLEGCIAHIEEKRKELAKDVHRLAYLGVSLMETLYGGVIVKNISEPSVYHVQNTILAFVLFQ